MNKLIIFALLFLSGMFLGRRRGWCCRLGITMQFLLILVLMENIFWVVFWIKLSCGRGTAEEKFIP